MEQLVSDAGASLFPEMLWKFPPKAVIQCDSDGAPQPKCDSC